MESQSKPFSPGKRLFELLQEQQEPFLLKSQQPSINCWPTEACIKFLRFSSNRFRRQRGGRDLTTVLPKKWNLKLRKALNWETRVHVDGIGSLSGFFAAIGGRQAGSGRFRRLLHSCEEVLDGRRFWKTMADSKQLSPVSVFELHSDEGCSAHNHSMEEENTSTSPLNPEAADEEPHYKQQQNKDARSNQLLQQCGKEFGEMIFGCRESLGNCRAAKAMEMQFVFFGAGSRGEWLDVDGFGTTTEEWNRFQAEENMEIGLVIESYIFDEIREEVVAEILGSHRFVQRVSL